MRFEKIFEDLEGRFEYHEREHMRATAEDLARAERAELTLSDRLRGSHGQDVTVYTGPSLQWRGDVQEVGPDWLGLRARRSSSTVVIPLASVDLVRGLSVRARPAPSGTLPALGLGSVLRSLARDRAVLRIETAGGPVTGRIAAVGADWIDLQHLPTGENSVSRSPARLTVMLSALLAVVSG